VSYGPTAGLFALLRTTVGQEVGSYPTGTVDTGFGSTLPKQREPIDTPARPNCGSTIPARGVIEMERRPGLAVLSAIFCAISLAAAPLTQGCGGSKVELGPKPPVQSGFMAEADYAESVDDMRAWLQSLSAKDAKKLQESGRVTFRYGDLKESDPVHAQIVDRYVKSREASVAEAMRSVGKPAPHFDVQTVAFIRQAPGAYQLEVRWLPNGGTRVALSDPL